MEGIAPQVRLASHIRTDEVAGDSVHEADLDTIDIDRGIAQDAPVVQCTNELHILRRPCASHLNQLYAFAGQ